MGSYFVYPGSLSPTSVTGPYSMALEFTVAEPCWVTSMGCWRSSASQTATVTARLYRMTSSTTGVQVGSDWSVPITQSGWNNGSPASPIPVVPGQTYRLVGLFPDFAPKVANYFTTGPGANGIVNGLLNVPNRANALNNAQNAFVAGSSIQLPTTANTDGPSYGIDVIVTDVDPAAGTPGTPTPIYGFDSSSAYGTVVSCATMKANGMAFAVGRVGQGASVSGNASINDSYWPGLRDDARANKMPLAGYWFIGDSETPAAQAARCRSFIGDPGIALVMDWELGSWSNFVACVAAFRAAGLNPKMIYSRYTIYQANGGQDLVPLGLKLWNSRYPNNNTGSASSLYATVAADRPTYWQTYGGITTKMLQFTATATVGPYTNADVTAFNGTQADVEDLFAPASGMSFLPFFPDRVKVR